jgi:hypothetical protein
MKKKALEIIRKFKETNSELIKGIWNAVVEYIS